LVEKWRRLLLAQSMTGGVIHVLVACPGIDDKQPIHQRHHTHRRDVLRVELHRLDKASSRM
jgi:hypothetical protein